MNPELVSDSFDWLRIQFEGVDEKIAALCQATLLWKLGWKDESRKLIREFRLATVEGSPLFTFQRKILHSWNFSEMFR